MKKQRMRKFVRNRPAAVRLLVAIITISTGGLSAADEQSEVVLSKYFEALGGREVWANGRGEYVLAKVQDPRFPLPGTFELCLSWVAPQTSDRSRFQGFTQVRAFTGTEGWTFRKPSGQASGELSEWDAPRKDRGVSEWIGNFEVLTHRIAKRDKPVSTRMGVGPWKGWVEISVDSAIAAYLLIDDEGAPRKFYRPFDDTSIFFGPLASRGDLNFPAWGSFDGGDPFDLIALEIMAAAPVEPFEKPDAGDDGYLHCR